MQSCGVRKGDLSFVVSTKCEIENVPALVSGDKADFKEEANNVHIGESKNENPSLCITYLWSF